LNFVLNGVERLWSDSKFEEANIGSILLKWMNFDGRDDDRALCFVVVLS
jgi:hypothetical protein